MEAGDLRLKPLDATDVPRMKALMRKYRDLPMDFADAALVRVAEREQMHTVFTTDWADFSVYRLARKPAIHVASLRLATHRQWAMTHTNRVNEACRRYTRWHP